MVVIPLPKKASNVYELLAQKQATEKCVPRLELFEDWISGCDTCLLFVREM